MSLPRPVRNNNPLDIRMGPAWLGLLPAEQMNLAQAAEPDFAVFKSPAWGFRAGAILLRNYGRKYGLHTLPQLVARLAPSNENNTSAYTQAMWKSTGFALDATLDLENPLVLGPLLRSFANEECGDFAKYWLESQIDQALAMLNGAPSAEGQLV